MRALLKTLRFPNPRSYDAPPRARRLQPFAKRRLQPSAKATPTVCQGDSNRLRGDFNRLLIWHVPRAPSPPSTRARPPFAHARPMGARRAARLAVLAGGVVFSGPTYCWPGCGEVSGCPQDSLCGCTVDTFALLYGVHAQVRARSRVTAPNLTHAQILQARTLQRPILSDVEQAATSRSVRARARDGAKP